MDSKDGSFSRAVAFAIATPFFGTIAATIAKFVQSEVSVYSLLLAQYSVCLVALFPWLVRVGRAGLRTQRPWLHLIRGLAGWGCYFFHYLALSRIPLVDGVSLRNTAPLFVPFIVWVVLKNATLFGEDLRRCIGFRWRSPCFKTFARF